ncbi:hypothetical protein [Saccharicrinis sp. 156]
MGKLGRWGEDNSTNRQLNKSPNHQMGSCGVGELGSWGNWGVAELTT